jgi:hypothetical protein
MAGTWSETMAIPLYIPLARDRAAAFRAAVVRLKERHGPTVFEGNWDDFLTTIRSYAPNYPLEMEVPAAVEMALKWSALENPSILELREAGALIELALADYFEAWNFIAMALKRRSGFLSDRHWIRESCTLSIIRHDQAARLFKESWPTINEQIEWNRNLEVKSGTFLEIDDAFARISGMTREQWAGKIDGRLTTSRPKE